MTVGLNNALRFFKLETIHNRRHIASYWLYSLSIYVILKWVLPALGLPTYPGDPWNIASLGIVLNPIYQRSQQKYFMNTFLPISVKHVYLCKTLLTWGNMLLLLGLMMLIGLIDSSKVNVVSRITDILMLMSIMQVFECGTNVDMMLSKMNAALKLLTIVVLAFIVFVLYMLGFIYSTDFAMDIYGEQYKQLFAFAYFSISLILISIIEYFTFLKRKEYA